MFVWIIVKNFLSIITNITLIMLLISVLREYTNISSRELDYSYDDSDEGTSVHIDKFRIQQDAISDLVSF